ncbi:MAG: DNA recombination protein RmuC [Phycisphaerae bacterium]
MEYVLYGIIILLLLGIGALLLKMFMRQRAGGAEADLRAELDGERQVRVAAETRLEAEREKLADQKRLLDEAEAKLKDAFKALSADALKESREQFLGQADERLRPIRDLLDEYQKRLGEIEKARNQAYGGLTERVAALNKETAALATALRNPAARGRWGELQLRRVLEMAGMLEHCDFHEQETRETEEGRLRPDVIVNLPNNRTIVVDSKAPIDAYVDAVDAPDEATRQEALARHARAVRGHMRALGQKEYWSQFDNTPDFVIMFLPGESFYRAAIEQDWSLIEKGWEQKVLLASPTVLFALCRAVYCGWQEKALAENARKIGEAGQEFYDRICVFSDHFARVGKGLRSATDAYNKAVGSYETRLLAAARRLAELGASTGRELADVEPVDQQPRSLPAGDAQTDAPATDE